MFGQSLTVIDAILIVGIPVALIVSLILSDPSPCPRDTVGQRKIAWISSLITCLVSWTTFAVELITMNKVVMTMVRPDILLIIGAVMLLLCFYHFRKYNHDLTAIANEQQC